MIRTALSCNEVSIYSMGAGRGRGDLFRETKPRDSGMIVNKKWTGKNKTNCFEIVTRSVVYIWGEHGC